MSYNRIQSTKYMRLWRKKNPDKVKANRIKVREYQNSYSKEWRIRNKDKTKKYYKRYWRKINNKICKKSLNKRISDGIRARIYLVLMGKQKSAPTRALLGCSISEFKAYIDLMFKDGMSWENYGKWHLDHIKPCKSFDLTKDYNQEACFHYTNYQPLWAYDNIVKDKSTQSFQSVHF